MANHLQLSVTNIKKKMRKTTKNGNAGLRLRMAQVSAKIRKAVHPSTTYMPFILQYYPDIDQEKVRQAMNGRFIDEMLIEKLDNVADKLKAA